VQTALTQSEVWDTRLAVSKDSCRVQQRLLLAIGVGATLTTYTPFPGGAGANMGARVNTLGSCFSRWRLNRVLLRLLPQVAGTCSVGFIDDPDSVITPTAVPAINDLRCSRSFSTLLTDSGSWELEWTPVDRKKWYYTSIVASPSVSDVRFVAPFSIYAIGSASGLASIQVYMDITFEGAADPTATT